MKRSRALFLKLLQSGGDKMTRDSSRWRTLLYVYIFMLAYSFVFQVIPPVLGFIVSSLGISHTQAGSLMSLFALPGIFISIPGGILADLYGPRRVSTAALAIALAGSLLVGLGKSYPLLVTGRLITGIGAGIIAIVSSQMIARWFTKSDLGTAMGIYNTAMPVGTIFALNVFGRIAALSNWRLPVILTALYCLFVLTLFYFKHPGLPAEEEPLLQQKPEPHAKKQSLIKKGGAVWLVAFIWMMYNASAISYLTFAGDYYIKAGYDPGYAGFLSSLFMIGSLLFSPLVGYLTDRVGREEYFIIGGSTVLASLLLLLP
ncbi:MAG: MFS transporter, partial [Firmicutes bacterium]|nr:MFS transporter [Bacillota bacterium]